MKTVVIMQPTYLPWLGYFDLMDQSDIFVFLDSVQFEKRSWQQRNRIKTSRGEQLLTVPVLSKGRQNQIINQVAIDDQLNFSSQHIKAIKQNYAQAKYFNKYINQLEKFLGKTHKSLVDLNIELIRWIKKELRIKTKLYRSSDLKVERSKTSLLIDICEGLGATDYLSPLGAKGYIKNDRAFAQRHIKLEFHNYSHPEYNQLHDRFIPYLSVIDLMFNYGDQSMSVIRSGRK